ncbi:beta-propeller domain-containing protein [Candidatus Pacearchaeota archaeon]|nr:beta-propeller domain-containing protein [Candidatus Pacearchaeota archaeon]
MKSGKGNLIAAVLILVLVIWGIVFFVNIFYPEIIVSEEGGLKNFGSVEELKGFLKENSGTEGYGYYGAGIAKATADVGAPQAALESSDSAVSEGQRASDYSQTNIQVEGVDEPDIVKNDGKYIYTASRNKVIIVGAFPAEEMQIVSELNFSENVRNIFINEDKLIVFIESYNYITREIPCEIGILEAERAIEVDSDSALPGPKGIIAPVPIPEPSCGGYNEPKTPAYIYDISDRENPEKESEIVVDGNYIDARMIDNYVYLISNKWINLYGFNLPSYSINGVASKVAPEEIYYFDSPDDSYVFTSVSAIDIESGELNKKVFLIGSTNTIYVSEDNIYLTAMKRLSQRDHLEKYVNVLVNVLPADEEEKIREIENSDKYTGEKLREMNRVLSKYIDSLDVEERSEFAERFEEEMNKFYEEIYRESEKTVIHKINVEELDIDYVAEGEVNGRVLNQFSMDEFKGTFRITTTTGEVWGWRGETGKSQNHLYVLDSDMNVIGKVEGLAEGERIYSTRFIGERAYIVTFKKIDPLFVIDLSNPEEPKVLGYLKITGYSDYLHPYDENHIIGIGKETRGGNEQFSWYQGLKISLFDVSDFENPKEVAKIEIGDRGTDSYALQDHKAFLFDKERNLLVIPIALAEINKSFYEKNYKEIPDWAYGEIVWQGAYVFDIDLEEIDVRGKITHFDNETEARYFGYWGKDSIKRALYMDDVLYTISEGKVKANELNELNEIKEVELPIKNDYFGPIYYAEGVVAKRV